MKNLAIMNPDRHHVGPNFEECLSLFSCQREMSRATNISDSSINHILCGRPIHRDRTRERYEAMCRVYLESLTKPATPHIETPPTQQALDLDPPAVFLVSLPSQRAEKLKTVLAMFGAQMVEVD